jgi:hypothetical protein
LRASQPSLDVGERVHQAYGLKRTVPAHLFGLPKYARIRETCNRQIRRLERSARQFNEETVMMGADGSTRNSRSAAEFLRTGAASVRVRCSTASTSDANCSASLTERVVAAAKIAIQVATP